jgi:DNA-binding Lrp family transcriptional regulator
MVLAYVLVTVKGEDASIIAERLSEFEEISSIHLIYGEYDIIARIKAKNMIDLREFTVDKLMKVQGIEKTTTLIVADVTKETDAQLAKTKFTDLE